ncbi:hypothetical protein P879_09958 [Paragonimus westermani]|uniref:Aftiphilin clathrin-binding box domain-containing protein n=1 Tax=Paragonimus westermani TaxID=34504 RepID=A0A8T0DBA2_9TREM|nr:hypothetical protein P879_09958 [Paragonimus westermani]
MESPMGHLHIPQDLRDEDWPPESSLKSDCTPLESEEINVVALSSRESDTVSSDRRSDSSSLSDFMSVDLPADVPDGPEFRDLSLHLDKVAMSARGGNLCVDNGESADQQSSQTEEQAACVKLNAYEVDNSSKFTQTCADAQPAPSAENSASSVSCSSGSVQQSHHSASLPPDLTLNSQASHASCDGVLCSMQQSVTTGHSSEMEDFAHFTTCECPSTDSACWPVFTSENPACEKFASFTVASPNVESNAANSNCFCPSELPTVSDRAEEFNLHVDHDNEDDDDFGDFTGSCVLSGDVLLHDGGATSDEAIQPPGFLERLLSHLEPALGRAFGQAACDQVDYWLSDISAAHSIAEPSMNSQRIGSPDHVGIHGCPWKKLLPLSRIPDLRYHWSNSVIYKAYLHSLNVDASHAMPIFASQLRLLEPVRVSEIKSSEAKPLFPEPVVMPSKADTLTMSNHVDQVTVESIQIPAFDWNSSDFVNPLKGDSETVSQMDLDFFEMQQSAPTTSTGSITSPLSDLEFLSAEVSKLPAPKVLTLASMSISPNQSPTRSANVRAALARLPKLTYMRARSLLFPVSETNSG